MVLSSSRRLSHTAATAPWVSVVIGAGAERSAKLPGPPATTLKLGKPGWRPRSASAVGSARPFARQPPGPIGTVEESGDAETQNHRAGSEPTRVFGYRAPGPLVRVPMIHRHSPPVRIDLPGVFLGRLRHGDRRCPGGPTKERGTADQKTQHTKYKPPFRLHLLTERHLHCPL